MEGIAVAALLAVILVLNLAAKRRPTRSRRRPPRRYAPSRPRGRDGAGGRRPYPGDFVGRVLTEYSARIDGKADPGEVVWTWVPFEDDPTQGKDRPVLIIGRDGDWLLALMLTSKDHDRDAADEARWGRRWLDIGAGEWDRARRPSEVRLDRVVRVHPEDVRREGAVMDRTTFNAVAAAVPLH